MSYYKKRAPLKSNAEIEQEIKTFFAPLTMQDLVQPNEEQTKEVINKLELFTSENAEGITSSQLRKMYDKVIDGDWKKIAMLRPEFAYTIAKQPNEKAKKMMILADELAKVAQHAVGGYQNFLKNLVAFHKYFEMPPWHRKSSADFKQEIQPLKIERMLHFQTLSLNELDEFFKRLENFIKANVSGITSTQMRRLFDQSSSAQTPAQVQSLRPIFAYAAARQERKEAVQLMLLAMELSREVNTTDQVIQFHKLMEVIVSFHKFYEAAAAWNKKRKDRRAEETEQDRILKEAIHHFGRYKIKDLLEPSILSYEKLQKHWQKFIFDNLEGIKSSQLRRLYDTVQIAYNKTNAEESVQRIKLLRPFFLYTVARQNNNKAKRLILLLSELIKEVNEKKVHDFFQLMEDIVAYHSYFESTIENNYFKNQHL
ncbi:MAG: type III-A CRISPR-associated protein Csm2 [Bacteroidota bacterium]